MLSKIPKKKAQVLTLTLILSVLLITTATFAVTKVKLIKAKNGGVIAIGEGIQFRVPAGSLKENTEISVEMVEKDDYVEFTFGPSGIEFAEGNPAQLCITWKALGELGKGKKNIDTEDIILYGEDGKPIDTEPEIEGRGVVWKVKHFSIYYHRRR